MKQRKRCPKCREERDLVAKQREFVLHALPVLRFPLEIVDPYACATCGKVFSRTIRTVPTDTTLQLPDVTPQGQVVKRKYGQLMRSSGSGMTALSYPAISLTCDNVLFPIFEGRLSDGSVIGRYGDPDLMHEFAMEYLRQFHTTFPKGDLPQSLTKMMPALHLLVNAAELALKAYLIRSDKTCSGHELKSLFYSLEEEHKKELELRFSQSEAVATLIKHIEDPPSIASVLDIYENSSFGEPVYLLTRYFAEPTIRSRSSSLKGGNLVKDIPYPIFLPKN